jgi:hypothetical protein
MKWLQSLREPPGLKEHRDKKPAILAQAKRDRRKKNTSGAGTKSSCAGG